MNRLERHIEHLLLSNDCVIVPGLGGFVAHHVCARYVDDEGLFLPPLRTLGFNAQLTLNDSLLAQSYADALDVSLPEAGDYISADVAQLQSQLASTGEVELSGLGRLYTNADGHLAFDPCEAGILTPSLYALSSFEISQLRAAAPTEDAQAPRARAIYIGREDDGRQTIRVSLRALRNTAVAAILIAATFLLPAPASHHGEQLAQGSQTALVDKVRDTVDSMLAPKPQPAPKAVASKAAPAPQNNSLAPRPSSLAPKYSIVLCSHVSKAGAEAFAQQAIADGLHDVAATQTNGVNKVVMGHYATRDEALQALRTLRSNTSYQQAWILERDL